MYTCTDIFCCVCLYGICTFLYPGSINLWGHFYGLLKSSQILVPVLSMVKYKNLHRTAVKTWHLNNTISGPMGVVLKNDVHYVLVICNPGPFVSLAPGRGHSLSAMFDISIVHTVPWNHGHGAFDSHAQTAEVISHLPARI